MTDPSKRTRWLFALPLPLLFGCGSGGKDDVSYANYEISSGDLSGEIAGESWTFVSGTAEDFGDGEYWITLYDEAPAGDDPCAFDAYDFSATNVFIVRPLEEVDVELSLEDNITFFYDDEEGGVNEIVTEGRLIIDEVTETTVAGALFGTTEDSELDGRFEAVICD